MFITLVLLSTAGVKLETPETKKPKLECTATITTSAKLDRNIDNRSRKCVIKLSTPEQRRVEK